MSGEFDVFDEWGNYVGKFTPAGGGWEGCLLGIAMFLLLAATFVVYQWAKLFVRGFEAAKKGEWGDALSYWVLAVFIASVVVVGMQ